MEYNTTHEHIIDGLKVTTYFSMTVTPVEEAPSPDETTDANHVDALIEAAIYNHYPPIEIPSEFKRVFARAQSEYEAFKGTPAEKASAAVNYAIWVKYANPLIEDEIARHSPTIAEGAEFKAVYDKAVDVYRTLGLEKKPVERAIYAVERAIKLVCPDKSQPVTPTPAELISEVIAERWPARLGLISTKDELKIAYRARAIFNEFAGSDKDKAAKAVEHAFKELIDKAGEELEARQLDELIGAAIKNHPRINNVDHPYSWPAISKRAKELCEIDSHYGKLEERVLNSVNQAFNEEIKRRLG